MESKFPVRVIFVSALLALVGWLMYGITHWLQSEDLFFWADEITVISIPDSMTYWQLWEFLPHNLYGSRPLGFEFNKLLYDLFGMNYHGHIYVFVAVHLLNVFLVYVVFARLLGSRLYAYVGCVLYATYYPALATVFFVGAAFDLLSTTFLLLSFAAFFHESRWGWVISVGSYYLSLRAKEAGIALPLILTLYVWSQADYQWSWQTLKTILRRCAGHYAILLLFLAVYAYLSRVNPMPESDPYRLQFTDTVFFHGLVWYINRLCYTENLVSYYTLVFSAILAASFFLRWKPGILGGVGFILALLPVIFLAGHQEYAFYLYGPAIFFVLVLAGLIQEIGSFLQQRLRIPVAVVAVLAVAFTGYCGWAASRATSTRCEQAFAVMARQPMARIYRLVREELPDVEPGTCFYITGLPANLIPIYEFYTEGAKLFRLVFHDPSIECCMEGKEGALRAKYDRDTRPRYFIDYHDGSPTLERPDAPVEKTDKAAGVPQRTPERRAAMPFDGSADQRQSPG